MIRLRDISLSYRNDQKQLSLAASRVLRIPASKIKALNLVRRSVDARKKPEIRYIYTIDVEICGDEEKIIRKCGSRRASIINRKRYAPPSPVPPPLNRPVVVGFGPAGMFAALVLALAGCRPLVLERGQMVTDRYQKVQHFFKTGELDPDSNIQFGEGGAGTFSDGKLNTGVNNPRIDWILEQFVEAGARNDILFDAKPHVGTDILLKVCQNLRNRILELGGEIRFQTKVTDFKTEHHQIVGIVTDANDVIPCENVVLAIGHSARDTFEFLDHMGIPMEAKPFSMGVRIEHLQSDINMAQYGLENNSLPPADYKLVKHLDQQTVYTFCMCPGGYVVAAASEEGHVVTNGMSYADRDGINANAALLVTVSPEKFPGKGPLAGMYWQRDIEQAAYRAANETYFAPAQTVGDFLKGKPSQGPGTVQPTYQPGVVWGDIRTVLPDTVTSAIAQALPMLDEKLKGFAAPDAVMTAPETRSSSPVRILRDSQSRQSNLGGLYPVGEGAGYAGGIMSAAIDGIMTAERLIEQWRDTLDGRIK